MTVWRVDLPFECEALNMNQTLHKAVKSKRIREIRMVAEAGARTVGIPRLERFTAELHYVPRTRQRRDPENWTPTSKAVVDGLVLAGVADDDSPEYFTPSVPVIDPPLRECATRYYVLVRSLPTTPVHTCPVPGCDHNEEIT